MASTVKRVRILRQPRAHNKNTLAAERTRFIRVQIGAPLPVRSRVCETVSLRVPLASRRSHSSLSVYGICRRLYVEVVVIIVFVYAHIGVNDRDTFDCVHLISAIARAPALTRYIDV